MTISQMQEVHNGLYKAGSRIFQGKRSGLLSYRGIDSGAKKSGDW